MITAGAASSAKRARRPAGALRLLWLVALLFAFLYTHAAGADTATAHVARGVVPVAHLDAIGADAPGASGAAAMSDSGAAEAPHGHGDGSGHAHAAEACVSGHPQQGAELPAPPLVPLGVLSPAASAMRPALWVRTVPSGLPPLRSVLGSVVQQV
ncbi:hypothetical protein OG898_26270 [Streptomyces sp. NBC_00193]|uniref:hypothetical protein n=1 Tax=Streptomyces sp. NBC_00193 TaxID=2975675 RepID=UPI0022598B95|nr:hypothetical protein [Streptomyces sp. NBC_00193]MCX5299954.1 hypothetical protein [Streptomyces sp. NBC_00193]